MTPYSHTPLSDAFNQVVTQRSSSRAYLPEPIPASDIEHALALACQAPSNCNTQPWKIAVASGAACERLAQAISSAMMAGQMNPDLPYDGQYPGIYKERQFASAQALYAAVGIAREDRAARQQQFMQNYRFFGAPHVAFFFLPPGFGTREAADLGMCAQTFMLALSSMGYGSCPQTSLSFHPDIVRGEFGIEPGWTLMFGISFGRPDGTAAVNTTRVGRDVANCTVLRSE